MAASIFRFAGPAASFLVALGFQVSGYTSPRLAAVCFGLAIIWLLVALVTWEPIRRGVRAMVGGAATDTKSVAHRRLEVQFLINLKETATHMILNRPMVAPGDAGVQRLQDDFDWWDKEVQAALGACGATAHEKGRFRTLVQVPAVFTPTGPGTKIANELVEKLHRLDEIIERMS